MRRPTIRTERSNFDATEIFFGTDDSAYGPGGAVSALAVCAWLRADREVLEEAAPAPRLRGEGEESTFNHILTPGDKAEWPLTLRDGETIVATASSKVFDPAIQGGRLHGKVIAETTISGRRTNCPGAGPCSKAGAYKILVLDSSPRRGAL